MVLIQNLLGGGKLGATSELCVIGVNNNENKELQCFMLFRKGNGEKVASSFPTFTPRALYLLLFLALLPSMSLLHVSNVYLPLFLALLPAMSLLHVSNGIDSLIS